MEDVEQSDAKSIELWERVRELREVFEKNPTRFNKINLLDALSDFTLEFCGRQLSK